MKKILLTILVLILIAGGSIGGYWYGTEKNKIKNETAKTGQIVANGIYLKDMRIIDAGSGLKKYKNDKYGFEFFYPSDYELDVKVDFEDPSYIVFGKKEEGLIEYSVRIIYNPTFLDPIALAKQNYEECLLQAKEYEAKGEPTGVPCQQPNTDQWKVIKINDHITGFRTGISSGVVLQDTYYLTDSNYKGRMLYLSAYIQKIPSRSDDDINDPVEAAKNDKNIQESLKIFDQIINSTKVNWLDN